MLGTPDEQRPTATARNAEHVAPPCEGTTTTPTRKIGELSDAFGTDELGLELSTICLVEGKVSQLGDRAFNKLRAAYNTQDMARASDRVHGHLAWRRNSTILH